MRNYKKISECPPKLNSLIEIFNLLPNELFMFLEDLPKSETNGKTFEDIKNDFCNFASQLDIALRRTLAGLYGGDWVSWRHYLQHRIYEKVTLLFLIFQNKSGEFERYCKLRDKIANFNRTPGVWIFGGDDPLNIREIEKERFNAIGVKFTDLHTERPTETDWFDFERLSKYFNMIYFKSSIQPTLDKNGYLVLETEGLAKIITEERIKLERVKVCPICNFIFWAKKKNSETCGRKKCIDALGNSKRLEKTKTQNESKKNLREQWKNQDFSKK